MTKRHPGLAMVGVLLLAGTLAAQRPARPGPGTRPAQPPLLIRVKKAHIGRGPALAPAQILVRGARIVAVGQELPLPPGAQEIDLSDLEAAPAWVDAWASTFLDPAETQGAGPDATMRVALGLQELEPRDARTLLAAGIGSLCLVPALGPGQGPLLAAAAPTPGGKPVVLLETAGLPLTFSLTGPPQPLAPKAAWEGMRKAFLDAKEYRKKKDEAEKAGKDYEKAWNDYLAALRRQSGTNDPASKPAGSTPAARPGSAPASQPAKGGPPPTRPKRPAPFKADPAKEALLLALDGKVPVRLMAHVAAETRYALRLASEFKLRAVLVEPWELDEADLLRAKELGLTALFGPLDRPAGDPGRPGFSPALLVRLAHGGVPVAVGSQGALAPRFLGEQAALLRAFGLTSLESLQAVTSAAARAAGLEKTCGALEPGLRADILFFPGDPLDPTLTPSRVLHAGRFLEGEVR